MFTENIEKAREAAEHMTGLLTLELDGMRSWSLRDPRHVEFAQQERLWDYARQALDHEVEDVMDALTEVKKMGLITEKRYEEVCETLELMTWELRREFIA